MRSANRASEHLFASIRSGGPLCRGPRRDSPRAHVPAPDFIGSGRRPSPARSLTVADLETALPMPHSAVHSSSPARTVSIARAGRLFILACWGLISAGSLGISPAGAAETQQEDDAETRGRRDAERGSDAETPSADLPDDLTIWPNKTCYRASEPWLVEHHDQLRKMRPRLLVINFANDVEMDGIRERTEKLIKALAESTRYHGFEKPDAPAFLEYEVVKYVDMRDRLAPKEREHENSAFFPFNPDGPQDFACDYSAFYGDAFARFYGFNDPKNERRFLNLHQLIEAGIVHEVWFYAIHGEKGWPAFEVIEIKQYYDERLRPIEGKHGPAGNGHDDSMPWSGRTFRMAFFNPHRGAGCAMENFAHGLEGIANHEAIPYWTKYFREFAELNFKERFKVPITSLYEMPYDKREVVSYPSATSMKLTHRGKEVVIDPYVAIGGNAHWPPGGRHQYDNESPVTVRSTIENYRLRNGPNGGDRVLDFNKEKFARYNQVAPDCMGAWIVFWRQCMPGLDNQAVDDDGKPMKNWWPFLFY